MGTRVGLQVQRTAPLRLRLCPVNVLSEPRPQGSGPYRRNFDERSATDGFIYYAQRRAPRWTLASTSSLVLRVKRMRFVRQIRRNCPRPSQRRSNNAESEDNNANAHAIDKTAWIAGVSVDPRRKERPNAKYHVDDAHPSRSKRIAQPNQGEDGDHRPDDPVIPRVRVPVSQINPGRDE
jgi:hypothetical protein